MEDQLKQAQALINSLEAQRNQAMNQVAQLSAQYQNTAERLKELEEQAKELTTVKSAKVVKK